MSAVRQSCDGINAARRVPVLLPLRGMRRGSYAATRRLLRLLLVRGFSLSTETARRLTVAEALALTLKTRLLLRRDGRMEPTRDVPTKGAPKGGALTDALRRTPADQAEWVVKPVNQSHDEPPG